MIANMTSATPPRIAIRSASPGDIAVPRRSESRYIRSPGPPDPAARSWPAAADGADDQRHDVGAGPEDVQSREAGHLQDHAEQHQDPEADECAGCRRHGCGTPATGCALPLLVITWTKSIRRRSAYGLTRTRW